MNITREEAIRKHREMWSWIAAQYENGRLTPVNALKKEWVRSFYPHAEDASGYEYCFCCAYAGKVNRKVREEYRAYRFKCERCPVLWPSDANEGMCETASEPSNTHIKNGVYYIVMGLATMLICEASNTKKIRPIISKLCKFIANLPEKNLESDQLEEMYELNKKYKEILDEAIETIPEFYDRFFSNV